jgi:glycerophosphoryl diester phosphodiesterase
VFPLIIAPLFAATVLSMPIDDSNPTPRLPVIVGHRGAAAHAPENTLASFRLGFEQGAEAIEGDFWLTRDGRIVAMHDRDLHRTTGDPRNVADVTLEEIRTFDAGSWGDWKDAGFAGEPVPTLEEVLGIVPDGRGVLIEIKDSPRIVEALVVALDASSLGTDQVTVISFDADVIASLKQRAPKWKAFWLTSFKERDGVWHPTAEDVVATARRIKADGVDVRAEVAVVDEAFAKTVRGAGLELHVWTVNDAAVARRMAEIGVDSITTDRPAEIREALRETR